MLIIVVIVLSLVLYYVTFYHKKKNPKLDQIKFKLSYLDSRIGKLHFYEFNKGAHTEHPSNDIYMCIRDGNGNIHDDNFLVHIALHECAHALTEGDTSDHPESFKKTFNELITKAVDVGLYDPKKEFPKEYCGKDLKSY